MAPPQEEEEEDDVGLDDIIRDTGPVPESAVNSGDVSRINSEDEDTRYSLRKKL